MSSRMLYAMLFAYAGLFTSALITGHKIFLAVAAGLSAGGLLVVLRSWAARRKERRNR